jgi:hypothetical protein
MDNSGTWWIVHLFRWGGHPIPLLNNWLTDLVFIPVVSHIALVFTRQLLRNTGYRYPLSFLLWMAAYTAIVFEYILPFFSANTTADPLNVLAYFTGAVYYYCVHQQWSGKPTHKPSDNQADAGVTTTGFFSSQMFR